MSCRLCGFRKTAQMPSSYTFKIDKGDDYDYENRELFIEEPICQSCLNAYRTWLNQNENLEHSNDIFCQYLAELLKRGALRASRNKCMIKCEIVIRSGHACNRYSDFRINGRNVCGFHRMQINNGHTFTYRGVEAESILQGAVNILRERGIIY